MLIHPDFLLGRAQPYPDKVRLCLVNLMDNFRILLSCQGPEGGTDHAADLQAGVVRRQPLFHQLQSLLGGTVEEVAVALCRGDFQQPKHQIRPCDPLGFRKVVTAAVGGQGAAIGQHHHRTVLHFQIILILTGSDRGVDVGDTDVFPPPVFQLAFHQRHGFFHVRHRHMNPQNIRGVKQTQAQRAKTAHQLHPALAAQVCPEAGRQQHLSPVSFPRRHHKTQGFLRNILLHGDDFFDVQRSKLAFQPV